MLSAVTLAVLVVVVLAAGLLKRAYLCYLYAFFITFQTLTIDVGLQITPERLAALGMLGWVFLKPHTYKITAPTAIFVLYAIVLTALMAFFIPEYADRFPILRGRLRWVFQVIYLLLSFVPILFIAKHLKSNANINTFINAFLVSCTFQGTLAFTQFLIHRFTGTDIFPLDLYNPIRSDSNIAEFTFKNLNIFRACGLGGEPKNLAYSMVVALTFLWVRTYILGFRFWRMVLIGFLSLILVLTWSTQGLFLYALLLFLVPFSVGLVQKRVPYKSLSISVLLMIMAIIGISKSQYGAIIIFRTIERISEDNKQVSGGIEDFDNIILSFLQHNPNMSILGTGMGNIHFHSRPYIPKELLYYTEKNVYVSKKGSIRLVSELGFVGLSLYLIMYILPIINIRRLSKKGIYRNFNFSILATSIVVLLIYLIASDGPPYALLMLSVLTALFWVVKKTEALNLGYG